MVRITARMDGFRRCGVVHSGTHDYPDGHFTADQLVTLAADPMLVVSQIPDEEPGEADPGVAPPEDAASGDTPANDPDLAKSKPKKARG